MKRAQYTGNTLEKYFHNNPQWYNKTHEAPCEESPFTIEYTIVSFFTVALLC